MKPKLALDNEIIGFQFHHLLHMNTIIAEEPKLTFLEWIIALKGIRIRKYEIGIMF